jgi:hypothetical protein
MTNPCPRYLSDGKLGFFRLVDNFRPGVVRDRLLALFHDASLAKHGQQSRQCLRIPSADSLLSTAKSQKSFHNVAVHGLDFDVLLFQPPAEVGDGARHHGLETVA